MGANSSRQSSSPVDMTPPAFANLQGPFAQVISQLLGFQTGGGQATGGGIQSNMGPGSLLQGQATTPGLQTQANQGTPAPNPRGQISANDSQGGITFGAGPGQFSRQQLHPSQQPGSSGGRGAGASNRQRVANNPFASRGQGTGQGQGQPGFSMAGYDPNDPNSILRGMPSYQGPLTTGIGANEQTLLDRLMGMQGGGQNSPAQQQLLDIMNGSGPGTVGYNPNQTLTEFAQQLQGASQSPMTQQTYDPGSTLEQFAQQLQGAAQTEGYDPNGNNPFVQAAIEAAQRPTQQALEETLSRTLPGRFTQAGQFTQPGGSSAFDRAAAIATRGAGQTMGDIATNISFGAFEAERGRQFEAQENARQREAESLAQELERRGEYGEAARTRQFAMDEGLRQRESQALQEELARRGSFEEAARGREFQGGQANADRQLEAAQALPGVSRQEIDSVIANLQAQALPRLIQDMGIERGMEQFNTQMNNFLSTLGIAGGVTRPVISQESSGRSSGFQLK